MDRHPGRIPITVFVMAAVAGAIFLLMGAGPPERLDMSFWAWFISCLAGEILWIRPRRRTARSRWPWRSTSRS